MADNEFIIQYQSLPESLKKEVKDFIEFLLQKNTTSKGKKQPKKEAPARQAGTLKGVITYIAEDFNEPLEDFKDYM